LATAFGHFRRHLAVILTLGLAAGMADEVAAATGPNPWTMCAKATNRVEREEGIPRQLLRAISKAESGRFHEGKQVVMAWPWTVMAEGRGRYLATKEEAVAEVEALRARGVENIDVGCMQVNLQYHPDAFASLDEAFDPLTNVVYAASFLKALAGEHGSWAKAAAYYHSQNPERYLVYRSKIRQIWRQEREKYLLALSELRSEQSAALTLASLIHVDGPLSTSAIVPQLQSTVGSSLQSHYAIRMAAWRSASAWLAGEPAQQAAASFFEVASDALSFRRAGPVRPEFRARFL
jgi:hypothetical protein